MKFKEFLSIKIEPHNFISQNNIIKHCDFLFHSSYFSEEKYGPFGITADTKIIREAPRRDSVIMARFKDGEILKLIESCRKNFRYKYVIVQTLIGDDGFLTDDTVKDFPENIVQIFSKNAYFSDPKLTAIPIGRDWRNVTENLDETYTKKEKTKEINLAYLNFSISTNQLSRAYVYNKFFNKPWVTSKLPETYGKYDINHSQYIREMHRHKFVFSPVGKAMDCYRTWDAFYAKCIPIIEANVHTLNWRNLPVVFTDDWTEIDKDYLLDKYQKILNKEIDWKLMTAEFWAKKINKCIKNN